MTTTDTPYLTDVPTDTPVSKFNGIDINKGYINIISSITFVVLLVVLLYNEAKDALDVHNYTSSILYIISLLLYVYFIGYYVYVMAHI